MTNKTKCTYTVSLVFEREGVLASVVTDGARVATYEHCQKRKLWPRLTSAIAYLETRGYNIIPDMIYLTNSK